MNCAGHSLFLNVRFLQSLVQNLRNLFFLTHFGKGNDELILKGRWMRNLLNIYKDAAYLQGT